MKPLPEKTIIKELYIFLMSWILRPAIIYVLAFSAILVLFVILPQGNDLINGGLLVEILFSLYGFATVLFVFVMGVFSARKLDMMVCMGATRRQFAVVQLLSGITLSLIFPIVTLVCQIILHDASFFGFLWEFSRAFILYLTGWIVVLGIQIQRVVSVIVGSLVTIFIFSFSYTLFTFLHSENGGINLFNSFVPSEALLPATGINLLIIAVFLIAILLSTNRVAIKVP